MTKKELVAQLEQFSGDTEVLVVCPCGLTTKIHTATSLFTTKDIIIHTVMDSPGETWKAIPGWGGKYHVSDLGNVRNTKGEPLSQMSRDG